METNNNITTPHVENCKPKTNPVFKIFLILAWVCILSLATYAIIYFKDSKALIDTGSGNTSSDGFVDDSCSVDDSSYKPERIKYNDLSTGQNSKSDKGLSASDKKKLSELDKKLKDLQQSVKEMNLGNLSGGNDFPDPYRDKSFWKPQPVPLNSHMKFYGSSRHDTKIIENPIDKDYATTYYKDVVVTNPVVSNSSAEEAKISKVTIGDNYTIIEIETNNAAPDGGYFQWCNINKNTYVKTNGHKYKMIKTENIEIAPNKTYFQYSGQSIAFKLYFPKIPKTTQSFDLIESAESEWKWYGIKL